MATLEAYGKRIIGYLPFSASASGVTYDNTQSGLSATDAQDAIDELADEKVNKSGDIMTGRLQIYATDSQYPLIADYAHSNTASAVTYIRIGNNIADGTEGSTYGRLRLYGKGAPYANLCGDLVTANRNIYLPDSAGTIALEKEISTVVQNGETATEAIPFGKRFYRNSALYRAIANIASGASFTSSNCESTNLNVIGEYVNSSNVTTTVPTATATNIRSMTLSRGVWVITAGAGYSTSFTQADYIRLKDGTTNIGGTQVRGTGAGGGHLNTSTVYAVTDSSATIYLVAYQASGSDKTTESTMLKAVRIS